MEEIEPLPIQSVKTSWTTSCCPQEMHGAKWRPSRTHAVERRKKGQRP